MLQKFRNCYIIASIMKNNNYSFKYIDRRDRLEVATVYTQKPRYESFERHMHDRYEILFFMQGDADYVVGDEIFHLQNNDMLFIRPTVYHYLKLRSLAPYKRIIINFSRQSVPDNLQSALDGFNACTHIPVGSAVYNLFELLDSALIQYNEADRPVACAYFDSIIAALKYTDKSEQLPVETTKLNPLLRDILRYIDDNLSANITVENVADKFFISPSWITHSFGKYLAIGFSEYVNRKKILHAKQMINDGVPIMETAAKCGFDNYSTFYLQYKKIIGESPSETKKKL